MIGRLSSAHIIVIHARQIVVNERVGVDHFHSTGKRQCRRILAAKQTAKLQRQQRTDALATRKQAVTLGIQQYADIVVLYVIFSHGILGHGRIAVHHQFQNLFRHVNPPLVQNR